MISKKEVQHIAKLARLGITKAEEEKFQKELSAILDYFKMLEELDTSKVAPTFHPTEKFLLEKGNVFREDESCLEKEEVVQKLIDSAPEKEKRYVKVKQILK